MSSENCEKLQKTIETERFTYNSVWNVLCFLIFILFIAQYLVSLVYFSIFFFLSYDSLVFL